MLSLPMFFFLLVGLSTCALAYRSGGNPKDICKEVDSGLPGRVSYPGSIGYNASQTTYYAAEERGLKPGCVFRPQSASEVSRMITLIRSCEGNFAIRSGGHMLWKGAANMDGGMTVDLRSLDSFSLSQDTKLVKIGGGTIFSDLYPKLAAYNVTVSGARLPGISAGGYLSGGGVGFFARSHGWASEHVRGYEIVLSDGKIVEATAVTNSDLWVALRGGSNSFGIITRYDIETIPQGKFWGGEIAFKYTQEALSAQAKAFSDYISPKNTDLNDYNNIAMMSMVHVFENPNQTYYIANALFQTKGVANPPAFAGFLATPSPVANALTTVGGVSDIVTLFGRTLPASIDRSFQLVFSFKHSDPSIYIGLWSIWKSGVATIENTTGLGCQFLVQPHPISNGTNPFGLEAGATNLVMATVIAGYPNAGDDAKVQAAIKDMVSQMEKMLQSKGVYLPYKYLNYADGSQDPFGSYGKKSKAQMQQVSKKYDDVGMFQRRVGGFKINP